MIMTTKWLVSVYFKITSGHSIYLGNNRIVGGTKAYHAQFPWQVFDYLLSLNVSYFPYLLYAYFLWYAFKFLTLRCRSFSFRGVKLSVGKFLCKSQLIRRQLNGFTFAEGPSLTRIRWYNCLCSKVVQSRSKICNFRFSLPRIAAITRTTEFLSTRG